MRLSTLKTYLLLLLIGWVPAVLAQTPVDILSPQGVDVSQPGFVILKHVGNVKIRHQGVLMFCDYAVRNKTTNRIDAYGHILLVQGDSVVVRGDTLVYEGNDRHASLRGRVMFQDRRTVLTTTRLDYYLPSGIAHAAVRSRVADDRQVLNSRGGSYSVRTKQYTAQPDNWLADARDTLRTTPVAQDRTGQLAVAAVATGLTDAGSAAVFRESWYSTASRERLRSEPLQTTSAGGMSRSDRASLAADMKTGGPVLAKTENLLRSGRLGYVAGKPGRKGWAFDRPVVASRAAPVMAEMPVVVQKNEPVAVKKPVISNVTIPVRPAPVPTGTPMADSRKVALVPVRTASVKEVVPDPAMSELERELNRVRRSKPNRRTGFQNAQ